MEIENWQPPLPREQAAAVVQDEPWYLGGMWRPHLVVWGERVLGAQGLYRKKQGR